MDTNEHFKKTNLELWNAWADIHVKSEFYAVDDFVQGKSSLNDIELTALGNIKDKSILHLQCHFGMDTLSLARLGACVTGVDFSDTAINHAIKLTENLKSRGEHLAAKFVCSDLYLLPENLENQTKYDIVFTSYGVINWLPDLNRWAQIIAHYLKPGGIFYIVDFHPVINMLNEDLTHVIESGYFPSDIPRKEEEQGSYVDRTLNSIHTTYSWFHNLSEIITSLRSSGLIVETLEEFPYSPYNCFADLINIGNNQFQSSNKIPLIFSIKTSYYPEFRKI